jgi:cobalt/nickel transport protein
MKRQTLLILLAVVALAVLPLLIHSNKGGEEQFTGADGQAQKVITQIHPNYKPWFSPLWEPPSGEIASLLFALQAALGAGILGYYFGFMRGKAQGQKRTPERAPH